MDAQTLEPVARRYVDEGYDVVLRPEGEALPSFLAGLHPDLIAVRGGESVVVEVKSDRIGLADDPEVAKMAELVEDRPGWRLDLVVLEPVTAFEKAARDAFEPTDEQLLHTLRRAEELIDRGDASIACLVVWGALEAAMRRLCREAERSGPTSPLGLAQTLYGDGFLNRDQYRRLRDSHKVRSQLAHGLVPARVDGELVREVVAVARGLVTGEGAPARSA